MPVMEKPTALIAMLDSEKLRSRNRPSGTSGSVRIRLCQKMNSPKMTRPATISSGTERKPVIGPQS